MMFIGQEILNL